MSLDFRELQATNNKPKALLFLFHGYGSNYNNLFDIAKYWHNSVLNDVHIICPNGPSNFEGDINFNSDYVSVARQWFSLLDRSYGALALEIKKITSLIEEFILEQSKRVGVPFDKIILSGFSQGCMLSLHMAFNMKEKPLCVLGYSGMLLKQDDNTLVNNNIEKFKNMNILMIHGDDDEIVPCNLVYSAQKYLQNIGINAKVHVENGIGHSINENGMIVGMNFIRDNVEDNKLL